MNGIFQIFVHAALSLLLSLIFLLIATTMVVIGATVLSGIIARGLVVINLYIHIRQSAI